MTPPEDAGRDLEARMADRLSEAVEIAANPQHVPVNMYEAEEALVIVAPLPGVMADDIEVAVEPRRVQIKASMRTPAPKDYLLHEWHYGPYERSVDIPDGYQGDVTARFGNGQLALRVAREGSRREGRAVVQPS